MIYLKDQLDLILKAQAGDVAVRNSLIEAHIPFIKHVIKTVVGSALVLEYLTDGTFGFIHAIKTFDEAKVTSNRGSYFWICIKQAVIRAAKAEGREVRELRKNQNALRLLFGVERQSDYVAIDEVHKVLSMLSESERYIVLQRMLGVRLRDLAFELGVSKQRISYIHRQALKFVRELISLD